jgi:hypothetical protein
MEERIIIYLTKHELMELRLACISERSEARKEFIDTANDCLSFETIAYWHKEYERWNKAIENLDLQDYWNRETDEEKKENGLKYTAIEEKQKELIRKLTEQYPGLYPAKDDQDFLEAVKKLEAIKQNAGGETPRKGNANEDNDDHE